MLDQALFDQLYRYCCSLTGDDDEAFDLLHDALERYLASGRGAAEISKFYMMRIIRNRFIDDWRRRRRIQAEPFDDQKHLDFDVATLEQVTIARDTLETLWAGFDPVEREILFLWAVEGYTTSEVAQWLELPRGTVLSRISRLRKRVSAQVEGAA